MMYSLQFSNLQITLELLNIVLGKENLVHMNIHVDSASTVILLKMPRIEINRPVPKKNSQLNKQQMTSTAALQTTQ